MYVPETKNRTLEEIDEMVRLIKMVCPFTYSLSHSSKLVFQLANSEATYAKVLRKLLKRTVWRRRLMLLYRLRKYKCRQENEVNSNATGHCLVVVSLPRHTL